jgi:hypothetical protein
MNPHRRHRAGRLPNDPFRCAAQQNMFNAGAIMRCQHDQVRFLFKHDLGNFKKGPAPHTITAGRPIWNSCKSHHLIARFVQIATRAFLLADGTQFYRP